LFSAVNFFFKLL